MECWGCCERSEQLHRARRVRDFEVLAGPAHEVAPRLLGATISHRDADGQVAVRIVEVEAYDQDDPASHTFRGPTERNAPMFERGGHLYVYLSHGIHHCVNVVCGPVARGEAVLLRGGVVVEGRDLAVTRRDGRDGDAWLAAGPGRLGEALGLTVAQSGRWLLDDGPVRLVPGDVVGDDRIESGPRVGVSRAADRSWRWWIRDAAGVSRHRRSRRAPPPGQST